MVVLRTERFKRDFKRLPAEIQQRAEKALILLVTNRRHLSLHVKKMEGASTVWELRVTDNYRVTFESFREGILLRRIGTHDMLRHP